MALLLNTPFAEFGTPFEILDQIFDDASHAAKRSKCRGRGGKLMAAAAAWPKLDLVEEGDRFVYRVDVPGVPKDKLSIEVGKDGRTLTLGFEEDKTAEEETDQASGKVLRRERVRRSFHRRVCLPEGVDADKIAASVKDGVLTLALPKAPESQPKKIAVE